MKRDGSSKLSAQGSPFPLKSLPGPTEHDRQEVSGDCAVQLNVYGLNGVQ